MELDLVVVHSVSLTADMKQTWFSAKELFDDTES